MIDNLITKNTVASLIQSSRTHKVQKYFNYNSAYLKRDDELGFGIGGSKVRKFSSILHYILKSQPDYTIIEGSLNSNNVLGISALLNSLNIKTKLVLPQSHSPDKGNAIWTKVVNNEPSFIATDSTLGKDLEFYNDSLKSNNIFVIKEGAAQIEALPGLLTLAQEIVQFSQVSEINFDEIFIDVGTGITAIGLLIGLELLNLKTPVFITLIAGTQMEFENLYSRMIIEFNKYHFTNLKGLFTLVQFTKPITSKSFGSLNQTIKSEWLNMMQTLGFPIDLTYTAKHFYTIKKQLENRHSKSNKLIMNCGSWFASRNHEEIAS